MAEQPNLFSSHPREGSAASGPGPEDHRPGGIPVWLRRIELFFYVVVRIYIGVVLLVLPWTPLWTNNNLFNYYPSVSAVLMHGAVRGIVSGLGLLNLWIALDEAIHYREHTP